MIEVDLNQYAPTQELIDDVSKYVGDVAFDRMTRVLYSTDASIYQMMPVGVVFPKNAEEIEATVKVAASHSVPILPRGGGSSLAGQTVNHALVIDVSRHMDAIVEIDPQGRTVRAQPGITLGALNKQVARYGLTFGPDPASADRATIGGCLGNNSTGSHSIIYGMTHDHTKALDVILPDGQRVHYAEQPGTWADQTPDSPYGQVARVLTHYQEHIATRYPKTFRTVAGYNLNVLARQENPNLAPLMVGSEGTLGVITEATLNLVEKPKQTVLALVHFEDVQESLEAVPHILSTQPSAVELINKMLLDLTRGRAEYLHLLSFIQGDPEIVLIVEYTGDTRSALEVKIQELKTLLQRIHHRSHNLTLFDPAAQSQVWYVRKLGLGILMSIKGDAKPLPFIEDAAVPVEHLSEYVLEIDRFSREVGVQQVSMYAHASAGCIHIRPIINLKEAVGVRQMRQIAEHSLELVLRYGGTTSGEHGEGIVRGEFTNRLYGPELVQAFREVKGIFDPNNRMNPGKIVDPPRMDAQDLLRYGTKYQTPYEITHPVFSFAEDGSFAAAVEMCNGAGVCRKTDGGVMCPSYQVTRDETHSTRGRANALRAAMMGILGPEAMTSKETYDVLDLCLSCHACYRECPSSVDMTKLKAEFLHHYYQEHRVPLRSRIFANIERWNALGQSFAPVANWVLNGPGKPVFTQIGIHPERKLPRLAETRFTHWFKNTPRLDSDRKVVFFYDTFIEYNSPHIGIAAVRVLEAAGIQVVLPEGKVDSGRPAVSKGLLPLAKKLAQENLAALEPYMDQGLTVVGCEPSSMVMLVNEYKDLVPEEVSTRLARHSLMLDQYLVGLANAGELELDLDDTSRHVLFHGHCQQKAFFGTKSVHQMLSLIPNCTIEEVESSCCGMAGSFGYESEHYDLSMQLAELSLAPAVRTAPAETIISAMGTSCREQIDHTTDRLALHPIEILASALR